MIQYQYVIVNLNGVVSRQFSSEVGMQRCPATWPNDPPGLPGPGPTPPSPAVHENAWGHQYTGNPPYSIPPYSSGCGGVRSVCGARESGLSSDSAVGARAVGSKAQADT